MVLWLDQVGSDKEDMLGGVGGCTCTEEPYTGFTHDLGYKQSNYLTFRESNLIYTYISHIYIYIYIYIYLCVCVCVCMCVCVYVCACVCVCR